MKVYIFNIVYIAQMIIRAVCMFTFPHRRNCGIHFFQGVTSFHIIKTRQEFMRLHALCSMTHFNVTRKRNSFKCTICSRKWIMMESLIECRSLVGFNSKLTGHRFQKMTVITLSTDVFSLFLTQLHKISIVAGLTILSNRYYIM